MRDPAIPRGASTGAYRVVFYSSTGPEEVVTLNTLTSADMERLATAILHRDMWFVYFSIAINLHNCTIIDGVVFP